MPLAPSHIRRAWTRTLAVLTLAGGAALGACDDAAVNGDEVDLLDAVDSSMADTTDAPDSTDAHDTADGPDVVDPCEGATDPCDTATVSCVGDVLTTCAEDANGCLVETTMDCADGAGGFCDDTGATPMCATDVCFGKTLCTTAGTACSGDVLTTCMTDTDGCLVEMQMDCAQMTGGFCDDTGATAPACSVDPCEGLPDLCTPPGTSCTGDMLTTCAEDANGCLVETTMDCADGAGGFCNPALPAACDTDPCFNVSDCTTAGVTCNGDLLETCAADANGCLVTSSVDCAAFATTCDDTGAAPVCAGAACVDAFVGAVEGAAVISGDNTGAGDELTGSCGDAPGGGEELVYGWIAPQTGCYEIDTEGSTGLTDSLLYVLDGCSDPTELACSEDIDAAGEVATSRVRLEATANTPYLVVVDGHDELSAGAFEVDIEVVAPSCTETSCVDGVDDDNDGLTDCLDLDCAVLGVCFGGCWDGDLGSATGTPVITASTVSQRDELSVGASCSYERASGGEDVVLRWVAPQTGCVAIDTENSTGLTDSLLYVFDDCLERNSPARVDLACDENGATAPPLNSALRLETIAGQELLIAVDAWDSSVASGEFDLNIEYVTGACFETACADGTDDDSDGLVDCADPDCGAEPGCAFLCVDAAHALGSATGTAVATGTVTATTGEDFAACGGAGSEVALSWTAPIDGCYAFDTEGSTYDTVLELRPFCSGASLVCDDDSGSGALSRLRHEVSAGEQLVVWLDAQGGAMGSWQLNVERMSERCAETACLDGTDEDDDGLFDCADPDCDTSSECAFICVDAGHALGAVTGTAVATGTVLATFGTDQTSCGGPESAAEVALSWTAPGDGCYVFDTEGSSYDTVLELRPTCTGDAVVCDDDSGSGALSSVRHEAGAGEQLVVWLDAQPGHRGDYQLNIEQVSASCTELGCLDDVDDDADGLVDCADPDCASEPLCVEGACADGLDDDGDGLTDCLDTDCAGQPLCQGVCPTGDLGSAIGSPVIVATNVGQGDDFAGSCEESAGSNGADVSLAWTAPQTGCYEIDTEGSALPNTLLYVLDRCVSPTELACNDDVHLRRGRFDSRVRLETTAGGSYVIVVDASSDPIMEGAFELAIEHVGDVCFETVCGDSTDDDADDLVDCDDPDCFGLTGCTVEVNCADAWDNDGDVDIDCADSDCAADPACEPVPGVHEQFTAAETFDLAMRTVTYTPDATMTSYAVTTAPATALPTMPGTGTVQSVVLALGDDDSQPVALMGGAPFSFYGVDYVDLHVGSNGFVTFGVGDTSGGTAPASFYAYPRIAGVKADLDPDGGAAGTITVDELADRVVVSFEDVPVWAPTVPTAFETFQITMFFGTGLIEVTYLTVDGPTQWVGISSGFAGQVYASESDFYTPP